MISDEEQDLYSEKFQELRIKHGMWGEPDPGGALWWHPRHPNAELRTSEMWGSAKDDYEKLQHWLIELREEAENG